MISIYNYFARSYIYPAKYLDVVFDKENYFGGKVYIWMQKYKIAQRFRDNLNVQLDSNSHIQKI